MLRLPATNLIKMTTMTDIVVLTAFVLLVNTIWGTVQFFELTRDKKEVAQGEKPFDLKDEYLAHGIILILIPWSIFLFIFIIIMKLVCFFLAE